MDSVTKESDFFNCTQVIRLIGVSRATVLTWASEGKFIGAFRVGDSWVFAKDFRVIEDGKSGRCKGLLERLISPEEAARLTAQRA